jgi:hypothetical protein
VSLMGQENGHVNPVEWPPSSASPATEGQQLGLLIERVLLRGLNSHESQRLLLSVLLLEVLIRGFFSAFFLCVTIAMGGSNEHSGSAPEEGGGCGPGGGQWGGGDDGVWANSSSSAR